MAMAGSPAAKVLGMVEISIMPSPGQVVAAIEADVIAGTHIVFRGWVDAQTIIIGGGDDVVGIGRIDGDTGLVLSLEWSGS